jgi:hypothetical protein
MVTSVLRRIRLPMLVMALTALTCSSCPSDCLEQSRFRLHSRVLRWPPVVTLECTAVTATMVTSTFQRAVLNWLRAFQLLILSLSVVSLVASMHFAFGVLRDPHGERFRLVNAEV